MPESEHLTSHGGGTATRSLVRWQLLQRAPGPAVRGIVRDYWGYAEETGAPVQRRELPTADIILIVNLGAPLTVTQPDSAPRSIPSGTSFVAGLHDAYVVTETGGSQMGVELRLSPLGAYRLLGQPMAPLANRTILLDDLDTRWGLDLAHRLQDARGWDDRFAALDAALLPRLDRGRRPSPEIVWAWRQMARSGGRVAIATLSTELGWSPKRLIARFREEIGLPPKQVARLLRFQRASEGLAAGRAEGWSGFARRHGFYDQAHLINEFRRFAGDTPEGLARRRIGPNEGFAAD